MLQVGNLLARGTKRRREVEDDLRLGSLDDIDKLLSTPKKKKLTTTSQYIYQNLFQVITLNLIKIICVFPFRQVGTPM